MCSCFGHGIVIRQQFHLNKGYLSSYCSTTGGVRAVHVSTAKFTQNENENENENETDTQHAEYWNFATLKSISSINTLSSIIDHVTKEEGRTASRHPPKGIAAHYSDLYLHHYIIE